MPAKTEMILPDGNGIDWIAEIRDRRPDIAIVVTTGKGDVPTAVEAMHRGADCMRQAINERVLPRTRSLRGDPALSA